MSRPGVYYHPNSLHITHLDTKEASPTLIWLERGNLLCNKIQDATGTLGTGRLEGANEKFGCTTLIGQRD